MRILMVSKACVVGMYQRKLEELARHPDLQLVVAVPPYWKGSGQVQTLERQFTSGYDMVALPAVLNGNYHLHFYPQLGTLIDRVRPDLLHMDEEPYNLATFHGIHLARRRRIRTLFFTWQNLFRRYPPPFSFFERYNLAHSIGALAGNQDAAAILRRKGFKGHLGVVPQFGVDPNLYAPVRSRGRSDRFVIGYFGRMVPEKGVQVLLHAVAGLAGDWLLRLVGDGGYLPTLRKLAVSLGLASRVEFRPHVPSREMPELLNALDVLVLPSLTRKNWKEQFGRVLVEAMACGVPVIGSSSGEIPHLIGDSGLVFPEADADELCQLLAQLMRDEQLGEELGERGRRRVLAHYTQQQIAEETYAMYLGCLSSTA